MPLSKITINANFWKMLGAVATIAMVSYAFYYDTNSTLKNNTMSIEAIEYDVNEMKDVVNDNSIFKGITTNELKRIQSNLKRVEDKQDKMIEMLTKIIIEK